MTSPKDTVYDRLISCLKELRDENILSKKEFDDLETAIDDQIEIWVKDDSEPRFVGIDAFTDAYVFHSHAKLEV